MRTRRTTKSRAFAITNQTALIANLAGVRGVYKGYCQSVPFSSVSYALYHQIVAKTVKLSTCCLSNVFIFRRSFNSKVFKNENSIIGNPLTKLRSSLFTKRFCLITLFPRQTFQDATHRARIFAQFLFRRFFKLNSRFCFSDLLSFSRKIASRNYKSIFLSRCNQGVSNTKINTDRNKTLWFLYFKSDTKRSFSIQSDIERINSHSFEKITLKCFRNFKPYLFSSVDSRYRKFTAFRKRSVTPSFSNQKHSFLFSENKRSFSRFFVGFCRSICTGNETNSSTFKLRSQRRFNNVIYQFVQRQSILWTSLIKTIKRNFFLISVKFLNRLEKVARFFDSYRYASLYQNAKSIPLNKNINQQLWRPRFLSALKDGVPAREI